MEVKRQRKIKKPNVVFVLSDQHRAQATGFTGNGDVLTPNLDRLAAMSVSFSNAVSGMPVCSPYRASLITGQHPLTHGIFVNDVYLDSPAVSLAEAFKAQGYDTAYIGKWHLDGHGWDVAIPEERRHGFDFWMGYECNHNYHDSWYYDTQGKKHKWEGYDAEPQTRCAQDYIRRHDRSKPFLLLLSWGPPHSPYDSAPREFRDLYNASKLSLRPNVPEHPVVDPDCPYRHFLSREQTRADLAGYYAHISTLDRYLGDLMHTIEDAGLTDDTLFVYTSDHGDMLGSQGYYHKQSPWDESILVPLLIRYPVLLGDKFKEVSLPLDAPDIMPTLLGLCGIPVPSTVEGRDFTPHLLGREVLPSKPVLLQSVQPIAAWYCAGGRAYRGVRTERHTYVRDLDSPWLLYDNENDPYQLINQCGLLGFEALQERLDAVLERLLCERNDAFLPGREYIKKWGYARDRHEPDLTFKMKL